MVLDRRYYERRQMARRREQEVDTEILGGAASWENVDRTEGRHPLFLFPSSSFFFFSFSFSYSLPFLTIEKFDGYADDACFFTFLRQ